MPPKRVATITKPANTSYRTIADDVWNSYIEGTPQSLKQIDAFMTFLIFTGLLQFVYCLLVGNYPFNAFLSGFSATVGQFVLAGKTRPEIMCNFIAISRLESSMQYCKFGRFSTHVSREVDSLILFDLC